MNSPKPKRRWLQFSIRSLLILTLLVGLWLGYEVRQARFVSRSTAEIAALGGKVECESSGWSLLKFVDRRKYGLRIVKVEIPGQAVDSAIARLQTFAHLREVRVTYDGTLDICPSWDLVNTSFRGLTIVAMPPDKVAAEESRAVLENGQKSPEATLPGRRLNRFRAKVKQGAEAIAGLRFLRWERWENSWHPTIGQTYALVPLLDGTLAELLVLEDFMVMVPGDEKARAVLVVNDKGVGCEEFTVSTRRGLLDVAIEDLDNDGVPELGFEISNGALGIDDRARQLPGDPRYWLGVYKIESSGFRSILPSSPPAVNKRTVGKTKPAGLRSILPTLPPPRR